MIRIILGGVGSGKSTFACRYILKSKNFCYGNFTVKHCDHYQRLRISDVLMTGEDGKLGVNWQFWQDAIKKHGKINIILDEIHNIMHSRTSMSKRNICLTQFVAQIRKITSSSEDSDLVLISQELGRVDVAVRDLAHEVTYCRKVKVAERPGAVYVETFRFAGIGALRRYAVFRELGGKMLYDRHAVFKANPLFKHFDTYEIISFGQTDWL